MCPNSIDFGFEVRSPHFGFGRPKYIPFGYMDPKGYL